MDDSLRDDGEVFEATVFLHHFQDLTNTRQQAKVVYPLDKVLLLTLLATLAGRKASPTSPASARKSLPC